MYEIEIAPAAQEDLLWLRKHEQVRVCEEIEKNLRHQPDLQTRRRKQLRPGHMADWELRIGNARVFYDVDQDASLVKVARIGYMKRHRLFFRGEELSR